MSIVIRPANPTDLDWLVQELKEFDKLYATKKRLFGDETYVRKTLEALENHVFLIAEKENFVRIGFISGIIQPHFFNPSIKVLVHHFWWVTPSYRKSLAASMLLDEFIEIGKNNADWITLNLSEKTQISPYSLIRRGFSPSDRTYLMEIE